MPTVTPELPGIRRRLVDGPRRGGGARRRWRELDAVTPVEGGSALLHGWDRDASLERDDVSRCTPPLASLAALPADFDRAVPEPGAGPPRR